MKGNEMGSGELSQFKALQCDNAHALARCSRKRFCDSESIKQESGVVKSTTGGEVKIGGKRYDNVGMLVTVDFKLTKVEVEETEGRLRVPSGFLPRSCAIAYEGCALDDMTLVIDTGNVDACPYREIRRAVLQPVQMDGKTLAINDEHKLLLELGPEG